MVGVVIERTLAFHGCGLYSEKGPIVKKRNGND